MAFCWYVARHDELMIDIDHKDPLRPPTSLTSMRARLYGAIQAGKLGVESAWLYPSDHPKHYHAIVKLHQNLDTIERIAWEMYLRDDAFRVLNNIMRHNREHMAYPSLLITSEPYKDFYRRPDDACRCPAKHSQEVMLDCPAAKRIRGDARVSSYFGKPIPMTTPIRYGAMDLTPGQEKSREN